MSAFLDQVADLKTREDYEALQIGVEILAGYYRTLATHPLTRTTLVGGHEVTVSADTTWQAQMAVISERFLRSGPDNWLPTADISGSSGL